MRVSQIHTNKLLDPPGRALVMQTGIIKRYSGYCGTSEEVLRQWERGEFGPMISSHSPASEELRAWGIDVSKLPGLLGVRTVKHEG